MSVQAWLCAACTRSSATCFCNCGGRETFLCDSCYVPHCRKAPLLPHLMLPLGSYGQHKIPGYFERFQARTENLYKAKETILKNLAEVERCIEEVSTGIETIVTTVREYGNIKLAELRNLRREMETKIQEAILEVENSIYQDSPVLINPWATDIQLYDGRADSLKFFQFHVDISVVTENLSLFLKIGEENINKILPGIKDNNLKLYDIETSKSRSLTLSQGFSEGIRMCFLSNMELLIVGSSSPSTTAYIINIVESKVLGIQAMHAARRLPGLIKVDGFVYVFGGDCRECEKLDIATKVWTSIPSLSRCYRSIPSRMKDDIYLIDFFDKCYAMFKLSSQTFHPLQLTISGLENDSLSIYLEDEILIITCNNQIGFFRPGMTSITGSSISGTGEHTISQSPPVRYGKEIYYVSWRTGNLNSFNLETRVLARKN